MTFSHQSDPPKRGNTRESYRYHARMRVTSKGQVTIPKDVRQRLGIEPGSEVEFVVGDDGVRLVKKPGAGDGAAIVAEMIERSRGKLSLTTEELMALTRGGHWAEERDT